MLALLSRGWRLVATVFCFAVFGLGGLVLRCLVFPPLGWLVRDPECRAAIARRVVHWNFRRFVGLMHLLGIYRYEVRGLERLQRPGLLILANHPCLIDIVFLIALTPRGNCIVKASLLHNPFTRGPLLGANYITNDHHGPQLLQRCVDSIHQGDHLIIFPEGTRTPFGAATLPFQRGSANIAVRAGMPVTPVVILCDQPFLTKGAPWWKIPPARPNFVIDIREDLDTQALTADCANEALAARTLNQTMQQFFEREVQRGLIP